MKFGINHCSVLLLLLTCWPAYGQEVPKEEAVRLLIEQLGNDEFKKREEAEERLIELGGAAVEALRTAAKSTDPEVVFRSQRALKRITELSPEDQKNLRSEGQAAFHAGDYESMTRCYRRLFQVQNASIDDGRWLGHAYQLSSQWKEAAAAYAAVIDRMDPLLDKGPEKDFPGSTNWPTGNGNALQERAAIIMRTARIQRYYLKDPVAAEKTLRRVYRSHDILNEPLDSLAEKRRAGIAAAIEAEKDVSTAQRDINFSNSLRFPLMALRELADVQQINGNHTDALESWRRIHLITSLCMNSTPSVDAPAIDRLIQDLPPESAPQVPAVTILDAEHPTAEFNLASPATLARSYDIRYNNASFVLSASKGQEFETLEFSCDIEQLELRYGGQFDCWILAGEQGKSRKGLGSIYWPNDKPIGRDKVVQKFAIEPGAGLVHFSAGAWKGKFKVHSVAVKATFRPRVKDAAAAAKPVPGFTFHTEFLPKGGTITLNGQPYGNETTSHNVTPGKGLFEYAHPQFPEPRKFTLDLKPGANYALFVNLDSPLTGELTNLRGFHSHYGPTTNVVKMKDGRWLTASCSGGLRFSSSDDLVNWSEPTATSDTALFNENYNCLAPTLHVDNYGMIWVAYFSNQLDIDQLNSGGYRLFLRSSKDGREWSAPRPMKMGLSGWPPGNVQMLSGPDGKTWMLYRLQYAVADSVAGISEFKDLEVPVTPEQRSHARNPQATFDGSGRLHLVWDHFGQTLYYARRDAEGRWGEPMDIAEKGGPNQRASNPQLILRDDQLALIYTVNQSTFLRRGKLQDGSPRLGEPVKLAPHTAPLISALPLLTADDRIVLFTGADTVWKQTGSVKALLGASKD